MAKDLTTEDTESTERATPETDGLWHRLNTGNRQPSWWVVAEKMRDHARKLERDLAEAKELAKAFHNDQVTLLLERDEAREALENHTASTIHTCHANCRRTMCVLRRERDEAREKIKRQASRICELEGATNHAGGIKKDLQENLVFGTPETDAMVERWQNSHIPADFSRRMETERNEARRLADTRLTQLLAITSSEPKDYLGLVVACRVHKDHIAQLIKERDEAREALADALQEVDLRTLDFERLKDRTRSAHFGPPAATGIILDADLVASIIEPWREIAARLALACIADGGDFREEVLRDYRKMLEEAGV